MNSSIRPSPPSPPSPNVRRGAPWRFITWNVNSLRQRLEQLLILLKEQRPDVVCLQELKMEASLFPKDILSQRGYDHHLVSGQKAYNGVAIISRHPFAATKKLSWCQKEDARHAAVVFHNGLELHNFYVPAGGYQPDRARNPKFEHKLSFYEEMAGWCQQHKIAGKKLLLLGDLNVAPCEHDVWNHQRLQRSVGHSPQECAAFQNLLEKGALVDVARARWPEPQPLYTWWGYRYPEAVARDYGWRLDHVLVTKPLFPAVQSMEILKAQRLKDKPSDHVPLILDLNLET